MRSTSLHTDASGAATPDAFGPFRVLHQIGAGALGPVFRAYEPDQDRLVAVKLFRLDLPPERAHLLAGEFDRLIAANLAHPSVAAPLATGITVTSAYLVQEFVAGESLDVALRGREPGSIAAALRVAEQLATALDHAAAGEVTHGALHLRDVMVSGDDVRLTGLGVAKALERAGAVAPVRRPYAPPERAAGVGWDHRCDIFSLAAIVYEMLSGRRVAASGEQATKALTELPGTDLAALRRTFGKALAADPAERFESGGAFVDALRAACSGRAPAAPLPAARERRNRAAAGAVAHDAQALPREIEPLLPLDPPLAPVAVVEDPAERVVPPLAAPAGDDDTSLLPPVATVRSRPPATPTSIPMTPSPAFAAGAAVRPGENAGRTSGLLPLALSGVVFLALGFAGGYGVASWRWPSSTDVALSAREGPGSQPTLEAPEFRSETASTVSPQSATPLPATESTTNISAGTARSADIELPPPPVPDSADSAMAMAAVQGSPARMTQARTAPVRVRGEVTVRSSPSGARVFVDGADRGRTPVTVRALAAGSYSVRIARDGFAPVERRLAISASRPAQTLNVSLQAERPAAPRAAGPGSLQVESRPAGATVYLDGRLIGRTPMQISEVASGGHSVALELDGYNRWTSSVRVDAGQRERVAASLEETIR